MAKMKNDDIKSTMAQLINNELQELLDTFHSYKLKKINFKEEECVSLNIKEEDGHYSNWIVRSVFLDDKDTVNMRMHLFDDPYRPDEADDFYCNNVFNCGIDNVSDFLIPGEITAITQTIKNSESNKSARTFSTEKREAIEAASSALENLSKHDVGIIFDLASMTLGYINTENIEQFYEGPNNEDAVSVSIYDLPLAIYRSGKNFKVSAIANSDGDIKFKMKNLNEKDDK